MTANLFIAYVSKLVSLQMTSFAAPYGDCENTMPVFLIVNYSAKPNSLQKQCGCVSGYMKQFNPEKGNCEIDILTIEGAGS